MAWKASGAMAELPTVGVVVVNYFGDERTMDCVGALARSTWPADRRVVAVVDNGSEPGFASRLRARDPDVRLVTSSGNLGFGGACNLGIAELIRECEYIALINNDALPDAGWLEPLVEAIERTGAGAATPKLVLEGEFVPVRIVAPTRTPANDARALGVQVCGARQAGRDLGMRLGRGFWGWEHDAVAVGGEFAWTSDRADLLLEAGAERFQHECLELRLANGTGESAVSIEVADRRRTVQVGPEPQWIDVGPCPEPVAVINNVGTQLLADGSIADRGFLEPDVAQYDAEEEVFGWSGAAVLLSRPYLEDVGRFDASYFLYYEDSDLSIRGRLRGWRYRYVPTSVVRHAHSATVGERSAIVRHLAARNRLLMLTKTAPGDLLVRALSTAVAELARAFGHDVIGRLVRWRRPDLDHVAREARVLAGYGRLAPHSFRERRRVRANRSVDDAAVWDEARTAEGARIPWHGAIGRRALRR